MSAARVLMYHGVDRMSESRDPHGMFVTPAAFRAQLEQLLESGFVPVTEQAFLDAQDGGTLPEKAVLITFDDGYVSVGEHAQPILESFDVPSVLYVPTGLLGGRSDWLEDRHSHALMSGEEVRTVHAGGMAIGGHGFDHSDLTEISDTDLHRHTAESRTALGELLGEDVRTFAFPFGCHDARVRTAVRDAGYRAAFSVHDHAGRFGIQRVDINATDTLRTFRIKLRSFYPAARRLSGWFPRGRRLAHDLLGRAPREQDDAPASATRQVLS